MQRQAQRADRRWRGRRAFGGRVTLAHMVTNGHGLRGQVGGQRQSERGGGRVEASSREKEPGGRDQDGGKSEERDEACERPR